MGASSIRAAEITGLARAVRAGDRRALARAITLVESRRAEDEAAAEALLGALMPHGGDTFRLGVAGAPGAGKSTFIEAYGLRLVHEGRRVAVLAVDPSSPRTGGAILGDKTRMERLAREDRAFIRPSPAGGVRGGVAQRTGEAILLCEAAGYDLVMIETVGVGQSETAIADLVDMLLLLVAPGGGDELQGVKRGLVELADLLVVTKVDGDLEVAASRLASDYAAALHLLRPATRGWSPEVVRCSALTGRGVEEVGAAVARFRATVGQRLADRRFDQARRRLWTDIGEALLVALRAHPTAAALARRLEAEVAGGRLSSRAAVRAVVEAFADRGSKDA